MFCESGEDLALTRTLFLRICSACYSIAFISLYPQISGLYGPKGILPIHNLLDATSALTKSDLYRPEKLIELIKERPTLLWFSSLLGLSPDLMMDFICLLGTILGLIVAIRPSFGNKSIFVVLWVFYQSIYQVCTYIDNCHLKC